MQWENKAKVVERKQLNIGRHVYTVVKLESNDHLLFCWKYQRSFKSKIHTRVLTAIYNGDWLTFEDLHIMNYVCYDRGRRIGIHFDYKFFIIIVVSRVTIIIVCHYYC